MLHPHIAPLSLGLKWHQDLLDEEDDEDEDVLVAGKSSLLSFGFDF
jgi:hypothetical protein